MNPENHHTRQTGAPSVRRIRFPAALLAGLGAGQVVCYLLMLRLGDLRVDVRACMVLYGVAFALYGAALVLVRTAGSAVFSRGRGLCCIAVFGLCFRAIMLLSPPALSDDIYRYVWEGRLGVAGVNPFSHAPEDPELAPFRDTTIYPHINAPHLPAIYPPLSQVLFALTAAVSPTLTAMNLVFLLFDIATALVLLRLVQVLGVSRGRIIIYAWNPLVVMEFAGSGHLDSAGIFFLCLGLLLFLQDRERGGVAALACSFLNKFIAVLLLPCARAGRTLRGAALFAGIVALGYLPYAAAGTDLFHSLGVYAGTWMFNASAFYVAAFATGSAVAARLICAGAFLALWLFLVRSAAGRSTSAPDRLIERALWLIGALILLSPVVHPWYVCWIVPLLVIRPRLSWLYLSGAVFLSYNVLVDFVRSGVWAEHAAVPLMEYVPFYALLLLELDRRRARHSK